MTRVVGLTGYATSGKDEVAKILMRQGYTRVAFADPLKDLALRLDPALYIPGRGFCRDYADLSYLVDWYGWDEAKERFPEVRKFLVGLGAGAREHVHPDVWIEAAFRKVKPLTLYVFSDVRYINEAEAIRNELGGEIWRIQRPGVGPANGLKTEAEIDVMRVDHWIENNGSLEALENKVLRILGHDARPSI